MPISISVSRAPWTAIVTGESDETGPVNRVTQIGTWQELRALADEYGVDGRSVQGDGVSEMIEALGPAPADM